MLGSCSRPYPLAGHLVGRFAENHLVDILTSLMSPTWNNNRLGVEYVGERLNSFMVLEDFWSFLNTSAHGYSNHSFMLTPQLCWKVEESRKGILFKFSQAWLEDEDFNNLVTSI